MALLLQELLIVAADLMLASVLSCLFYAAGCVVVPGLVGYVVLLSCGAGAMKDAKRSISQAKRAVWSTLSDNCLTQMAGKILGLAGFGGAALDPSEQAPVLKEERSSTWSLKQRPAAEKQCQTAVETLPGNRTSGTGLSSGMKMEPGMIWEEERKTSQKNVYGVPAFFLSLLLGPLEWCLKKRPFRRLAPLLDALKESRD